jgi:HD-like signal output (HDOD) protein
MAVSSVAERVVADLGGDRRMMRDAMLAGAVHDVGQLILAEHRTEDFRRAINNARATRRPLYLVEREIFGSDHAALGAYLLGLWGFADAIVDAVALHHELGAGSNDGVSTRLALSIANSIVNEQSSDSSITVDVGIAPELLSSGIASEKLAEWRNLARERITGKGHDAAHSVR